MANGNHNPEEILRNTKKGIYAKTFGGGQVCRRLVKALALTTLSTAFAAFA